MGSLSDAEQKKLAYFHALGKAMTEGNQNVYESKYKSSHNVRSSEVWSDLISTAVTYSAAVAESSVNSAVTLHTMVTLTEIPGSNRQTYYYNSGGTFIRPWISPVDVPNPNTNAPSNGYQVRLFKGDNTEISVTNGAWAVDYYTGIIHFSLGYTPDVLGWGAIKATFFQYTGGYGGGGSTPGAFTTVVFDSGTSHLIFNSGLTGQTIVDLSALAGDTSISTALSQEVSTRTSQIDSLSSAISTSNSGISSLSTVLSGVITGNTYDHSSLSSAISTEISTRTSVDQSLSTVFTNGISSEASTRLSVDTSLSVAILNAGGGTGVTSLSVALSVEESTRLSVDIVLSQAIADIVSGITESGGTMATNNIGMMVNTTTSDGDLACSTGVASLPIPNSYISVYINGIQVYVGDGVKTRDCYFSSDGGTTAKYWSGIGIGDLLYWNGSVVGYQLNSSTDKMSFIYLTI